MFSITSISELICLKIINIFWMIEFNKKSLPVLISIIKIGFQVIITDMKVQHHILLTFTFVFVFFLPRTAQFPQKMTCLSTPIPQRALTSCAVQSVYFLPLPNTFYLRIRPVLGYSLFVLYFSLCLGIQKIFKKMSVNQVLQMMFLSSLEELQGHLFLLSVRKIHHYVSRHMGHFYIMLQRTVYENLDLLSTLERCWIFFFLYYTHSSFPLCVLQTFTTSLGIFV